MTDLHSYSHGPHGLLKFGIGALLLEADPGHSLIRPTYMFYFCDIVCLPVLFNEYLWYMVKLLIAYVKTKAQISVFVFNTNIVQSSFLYQISSL